MVRGNLWDHSIYWGKFGVSLKSNDRGACDLMDTVGAQTSLADIWSGLITVETNCGAGAERCSGRKLLLA